MIAQIEQFEYLRSPDYVSVGRGLYDDSYNETSKSYLHSMTTFKEQYGDTEFFEQIIKECSFFRYYYSG